MMGIVSTAAETCVHCGRCRDACDFLTKYDIEIGDTDRLRELAYHCFLCGRCTEVCPAGIDGRSVIMELRRERASGDEKIAIENTYKGLIGEKRDYRFRNWKHVTGGTIFFPGCNFPSQFPKTCRKAERIMASHGIGTVYECCGKPVAELGFRDDEERILDGIRKRLWDAGVTEVVTACPNCLDFFGDRLGVRVRSIYSKLAELGEGSPVDGDILFYLPCPDRSEKIWIEDMKPFVKGRTDHLKAPQCCGLGGSAAVLEKDIAGRFIDELRTEVSSARRRPAGADGARPDGADGPDGARPDGSYVAGADGPDGARPDGSDGAGADGPDVARPDGSYGAGADGAGSACARLCTYCASCMGQFGRNGFGSIEHILTLILETGEKPDTVKSYINRVLTRFR